MKPFLYAAIPLALVSSVVKAQDSKPNILWIITDDQRADALECFNQATRGTSESALGHVSSPNINKLASEGVLFTSASCNSPLSGPSRASMHTGKYPHHNGMYNFQLKHNEHDAATPIVPEVMREAGYSTAAFGKIGYYIYEYAEDMWFNYPDSHYELVNSERIIERAEIGDFSNNPEPAKGEKVKHARYEKILYPDGSNILFKTYSNRNAEYDTPDNRDIREFYYDKHEVLITPKNSGALALGGESSMPTEKTEDGVIVEVFNEYFDNQNKEYESITMIKNREIVDANYEPMQGADPSKPQFIHLGFHFPHTPILPSKEYRDEFKKYSYQIPTFEDGEYESMPKGMQSWHNLYSFHDFNYEQQQQMVQDYYAFCAMGDELIGKAVDRFKRYCAENDQPYMIVFACGDHGWHLGEQGSYFKNAMYQKSSENAIVVVSSDKEKFPAGKVVTDYTEYVDFAPTFYAAAGLDLSDSKFDFLDGRDLYDTANEKVKPREYVIGEIAGTRAIMRSRDFSFSMQSRNTGVPTLTNLPNTDVKWALECTPEEADMGLYDLRVDPMERKNVAYDAEYAELAEWFRQKLGNIVLGDGRLEVVWDEKNLYDISNFAKGADDKRLNIPKRIIPKVK